LWPVSPFHGGDTGSNPVGDVFHVSPQYNKLQLVALLQ
jgi:hypothetical protein